MNRPASESSLWIVGAIALGIIAIFFMFRVL
jgi:hypothetical protein